MKQFSQSNTGLTGREPNEENAPNNCAPVEPMFGRRGVEGMLNGRIKREPVEL